LPHVTRDLRIVTFNSGAGLAQVQFISAMPPKGKISTDDPQYQRLNA